MENKYHIIIKLILFKKRERKFIILLYIYIIFFLSLFFLKLLCYGMYVMELCYGIMFLLNFIFIIYIN